MADVDTKKDTERAIATNMLQVIKTDHPKFDFSGGLLEYNLDSNQFIARGFKPETQLFLAEILNRNKEL